MNLIITLHFSSTQFDLEKILLISLIYKDVVLLERQEGRGNYPQYSQHLLSDILLTTKICAKIRV